MTDGEGAAVLLQDAHPDQLRILAAFGDVSEKVVENTVPVEGSIAGTVLTSRPPLIVPDVQVDPRMYREVDQRTGFVTRSLLGVPLQIENARLYEAVVDHAERLGKRIRERTAELQARNEELAAYNHTVAHDLKSPFALLIGYAELLEEDYAILSGEEVQQCLHAIAQHGHKMCSIIDALLLLAELRDRAVEMKPLDMARIVAESRRRLASMIEEYRAEIIVPDVWPVAVSYGPWIEEVWVNYLSNAIKYGGQPPRLELGACEQADGLVRFWVHDNGAGIPPDKQPRLFSRFVRLDPVRTQGYG